MTRRAPDEDKEIKDCNIEIQTLEHMIDFHHIAVSISKVFTVLKDKVESLPKSDGNYIRQYCAATMEFQELLVTTYPPNGSEVIKEGESKNKKLQEMLDLYANKIAFESEVDAYRTKIENLVTSGGSYIIKKLNIASENVTKVRTKTSLLLSMKKLNHNTKKIFSRLQIK